MFYHLGDKELKDAGTKTGETNQVSKTQSRKLQNETGFELNDFICYNGILSSMPFFLI